MNAASWMSGFHFSLALMILELILVPVVILFVRQRAGISDHAESFLVMYRYRGFPRLVIWTAITIFFLHISGMVVSVTNAIQECPGWPLCSAMMLPGSFSGWINLVHRLITLISALLIARLFVKSWRELREHTAILVVTTITTVLFFSQALMGAVESVRGYPPFLVGLHVVTAVSVWVSIVILFTLVWLNVSIFRYKQDDNIVREKRSVRILVLDYLMLTKPIVVLLLLVTTIAGMVVGLKSWPSFSSAFWTLLGGFLAAGGSSAINQYIDRFDDQKMQRTAKRPLPSGRLSPGEGLAFGVASALISFYIMVSLVNYIAALLTLAGIIYYVLIYSILLKKTTVQNIVIGGGAGAIPPLIGWAAATGGLNIPSLLLFAVIFLWTPPHFWALALVRRKDYARAGVPMLPVVRGEKETRLQIFIYTLELVGLTLILPIFGLGGSIYFVAATALGAYLLFYAWRVWKSGGNLVAWQMYRHSSMYLAILFLALMVDALV